jgi:GNAT superfamily N-acetyltransferase
MQELAVTVAGQHPERIVNDATVGELAWVYGKDHVALGDTWRHRLWVEDGDVVAWGWAYLPYRVLRSDGKENGTTVAQLSWQVHPERSALLDDVIDWFESETEGLTREVTPQVPDTDAVTRWKAHGYEVDEPAAAADGFWHQVNSRDLVDLPEPKLPPGHKFRTAVDAGPEGVVRAHVDAWHPSSYTDQAYAGVRTMWPYREDLHLLVEAPDGTLVSSAILWFDEQNRTVEFEPVGTHREYRRQGLSAALLLQGMHVARAAGAEQAIVACLGGEAHPAARALYYGVGFQPYTQDFPMRKAAKS